MTEPSLEQLRRRMRDEQRKINADLATNTDTVLLSREECWSCKRMRKAETCQLFAGWDAQAILEAADYLEKSGPNDVCSRYVQADQTELTRRRRRWAQTLRVKG